MASPYIGQILMFAGVYAPLGYLPCDGKILQISGYDALFAVIGTTYGGDGNSTFALPDLRARVPVHNGQLPGGSTYPLGQSGGTANVTLTANQLGGHNHALNVATNKIPDASTPGPTVYLGDEGDYASGDIYTYNPPPLTSPVTLNPSSIGPSGTNQPHSNVQPNVAITICICFSGAFPS